MKLSRMLTSFILLLSAFKALAIVPAVNITVRDEQVLEGRERVYAARSIRDLREKVAGDFHRPADEIKLIVWGEGTVLNNDAASWDLISVGNKTVFAERQLVLYPPMPAGHPVLRRH